MTQDSKVNLVILGTNRSKGDLKGMRQTSLPRSGVVYAQIKRAAGPKEKDREVRRHHRLVMNASRSAFGP